MPALPRPRRTTRPSERADRSARWRPLQAAVLGAICALACSAAAQAHPATTSPRPDPADGTWFLPVQPAVLERRFDPPSAPWDAAHRGVDLRARVGEQVAAPASGVVVFSGTVVDRGVLTILHASGLRSSLEPVDSTLREGDRIRAGDPVGTVQAVPGHCRPRTCVHWGVRDGEVYQDPLALVGRRRAVLLPLDG